MTGECMASQSDKSIFCNPIKYTRIVQPPMNVKIKPAEPPLGMQGHCWIIVIISMDGHDCRAVV